MKIDRQQLVDKGGRFLTESLFLEIGYSDSSIYTLKDYDHTYNGKLYPSIKKLYLEEEDTTEFEFANKYFGGWKHWQKLNENKLIKEEIDQWRLELELKLKSRAVKQMVALAEEGSYQASKWLADRGWETRGAGRPTKLEKEAHKAASRKVDDEYGADIVRLTRVK